MSHRLLQALRAARQQAPRRVSLDTSGLHAVTPDPATVAEPDPEEEGEEGPPADDPPQAADMIASGLRLLDAQERVKETGTAHAEAQAALASEEEAQQDYLGAYDATVLAQRLAKLTPRQRQIIGARMDILAAGDTPTHHEVGRRLGLSAANVSRQWARLSARSTANGAVAAQLSTPAA